MASIEAVRGDITEETTDAIVNAANTSLLGGGGVDGAIHRAAGAGLLEECKKIGGCPTGEARITGGHELRADYVIHTVGPVWRGGDSDEARLLSSCYTSTLKLADENGIKTIAFPSISTGAYGYPVEEASRIAVQTVRDYLDGDSDIELVRFVCFSEEDLEAYRKQLAG